LEALGRVQTVVLDKTGTLTLGKPEVAQVLSVSGTNRPGSAGDGAIAEKRSEHPLAMAVRRLRQGGRVTPCLGKQGTVSHQVLALRRATR